MVVEMALVIIPSSEILSKIQDKKTQTIYPI